MVAPGLALLPTTFPCGRRRPISRCGLYTLSPALEQKRADVASYIEEHDVMVMLYDAQK